jgi:hypothetical protein
LKAALINGGCDPLPVAGRARCLSSGWTSRAAWIEVDFGAGGLWHGTVHVAAGDERDRGAGGLAVQEHVDPGQVFGS